MRKILAGIFLPVILTLVWSPGYAIGEPSFVENPKYDGLISDIPDQISSFGISPAMKVTALDGTKLEKSRFVLKLKTFIIALTFADILEVRRRGAERTMVLSPENVQSLSKQVIDDWSKSKNSLLPTGSSVLDHLIVSDDLDRALKSLTVGSVHSLNFNYLYGFVKGASNLVLQNPASFGGLDRKQAQALEVLKTKNGAAYFFHGLLDGGPETKSAFLKAFHGIQLVLLNDHLLQETLWSHLMRESTLRDSNGALQGLSTAASLADESVLWDNRNSVLYFLQVESKEFLVSTASAMVVSAVTPDWLDDGETFATRIAYGEFKGGINPKDVKSMLAQGSAGTNVEKYLADRRNDREDQLTNFLSVMKLSLDRLDRLSPAKNSLENRHLIPYYESLYGRGAADAQQVYENGESEMLFLASRTTGSVKKRFLAEKDNMASLAAFTHYFIRLLDERRNSGQPSKEYWTANEALDQISFWGFSESEFLAK